MNRNEIKVRLQEMTFIVEEIEELESYIKQLKEGVMSKLGSPEHNKDCIKEYNQRIVDLDAELADLWNNL